MFDSFKIENDEVIDELPEDLLDLNLSIGICQNCKMSRSNLNLCLLCRYKFCENCFKYVVGHNSRHIEGTVLLRVDTGMYSYCYQHKSYELTHLYLNISGESIESKKVFPKKR